MINVNVKSKSSANRMHVEKNHTLIDKKAQELIYSISSD